MNRFLYFSNVDWVKTKFDRTVKMSTYLVTYAIGDFRFKEDLTSSPNFRIVTRPSEIKTAKVINFLKWSHLDEDKYIFSSLKNRPQSNWVLRFFLITKNILTSNFHCPKLIFLQLLTLVAVPLKTGDWFYSENHCYFTTKTLEAWHNYIKFAV